MQAMEEQKQPKHDWTQYFKVESFKRRGKGTVWRVIRLRDGLVVHRLVRNERRAVESAIGMLNDEVRVVERMIERTILG